MGFSAAELYGEFVENPQSNAFSNAAKGMMPDEAGDTITGIGVSPALWMVMLVAMLFGVRMLSDYNN